MNILLITVDCLRKDITNNKNFMPFLSSLKNDSITFNNYYSGGPITPYSFPSLISGKNLYEGISNKGLILKSETISQKIKKIDEKYVTFRINASNIWISDYLNYGRGFDISLDLNSKYDKERWKKRKSLLSKLIWKTKYYVKNFKIAFGNEKFLPYKIGLEINKEFFELYSKKLRNNKFFGWIHFMDTHDPFFPYKEVLKKINIKIPWKDIFQANIRCSFNIKMIDLYHLKL